MPKKSLMLGISIGIAGLVLLMTILIGGPGTRSGETKAPIQPSQDDIYLPEPGSQETLPLGEAEGLVFEVKERGILFFANRIVPKREPAGEIDVIDTTIQIHIAPGRELTIDADEGTIVAPDNHPQEGQMRGHVVVTLYETPDGSPVDFDSDRDVVVRTYFDEPVDFDLELQQIDSAGPIFMTGPQVEFLGRGLSMNYNQLRQRIERLVIDEGESLHYIPKPTITHTTESTPEQPTARHKPRRQPVETTTPPQVSATEVPNQRPIEVAPGNSPKKQTGSNSHAIQYYLANFEQLDQVRVGQDQYIIEGNDLSAVFSTKVAGELEESGKPDARTTPETPPTSRRDRVPDHSLALASADQMSYALAYALSMSMGQMPEKDPRSMSHFTDDDVIITWSGQLVVTPLTEAPAEIAGPGDVMVTVNGSPANVRTDKAETIKAPHISFLSQHAALLAKGTTEMPVFVEASGIGSLTGRELHIDQAMAQGHVLGPGTLTGLIRDKNDIASASNTQSRSADPKPLTVAFDDRLDLAFYLKAGQPTADDSRLPAGTGRIKSIKSADFLGNVRVDYAELEMNADQLTLALLEDAPKGGDELAVESITAVGNVRADVKKEDVTLQADRLIAYPTKHQLELLGSSESMASVLRPDATLTGEHMSMDERAGTVAVLGPGSFDFQPDVNDSGRTIHVTWVDSMHYDDNAGTARFVGDVKTLSVDHADTNELMGDDLSMRFVKDESTQMKKQDMPNQTAGRRLAGATMDGDVRFRARSYATAARKQLQSELYLVGPQMTFTDPGLDVPAGSDQTLQQVQIVGKGRMLITDMRPQEVTSEIEKTTNGPSIDIAGNGRTAFEWSDRLVLDLTNGQMLMKGAVAMVHQPEAGDRTQLDCTDLAAELKPASGSKRQKKSGGSWLSDDAPQPELDRIWADGGIRILHGPITVTCDHLLYQESKREIILWSDEPNVVVYEAEGEPTPAKSSAFKWHRDTGRVEAFRLRTGTIPLRKSEQK